ncbi:Pal1 cell morphology protein-domain-containing protein [Lactarius quietus]|nr:Pal1 cell morphology protein-domain-containing protein [Lactarius quietus]
MSNPFSDPPPVPPKQHTSSRRQYQQHQSSKSSSRVDPSQAHYPSRTTDPPPRTRPSRSQTAGAPQPPNTSSRTQPTPARRSHSTDSVPSDKAKHHRSKTKKSSIHADVIDRLDFTGVGPMFHHDGPFDACAPSRNKHRTKAPMYAWTSINAEDEEVAARYRDNEDGQIPATPALAYNPSYSAELSRSPPAAPNYSSYYTEPPKQKVDALAEAWGIHEPEPYEEFFAGGSDPDVPVTHGNSTIKETRTRRTRDDVAPRSRGSNRIPPPQPIFVGDAPDPEAYSPPSPGSGGANLSRNKSLMQRIRKMRDSPNVPVGFDERDEPTDGAPSPTSSTESHRPPAHRNRDSFLGRFTRGGRGSTSPVEQYTYINDRAKELPPTPVSPRDGYFDGAASSPPGGLGRKTSILKRVKGVVVRGK